MSTRFKNFLSILFVTLFLLGNVLSASAAAPEAMITPVNGYKLPWSKNDPAYKVWGDGTTHEKVNGVSRKSYDFGTYYGTEILAMKSGTVASSDQNVSGGGHRIVIDTHDGYCSVYLHLSELLISKGANVLQGQLIAKSGKGSNGNVHTHIAVYGKSQQTGCDGYPDAARMNEAPIYFDEIGREPKVNDILKSQNVKITDDRTESNFINGNSELTINSESVNLKVCADNLNGKPVYWQMWRNAAGSYPERVWNGSSVASGSCVTLSDMDGAGAVFADVTYYTVASLNPIGSDQAKQQRTSCYSATGGKQFCDAISYTDALTCTAGKAVGETFMREVINNLNTQTESQITNTQFAVKALQIWQKYEGTSACWNPLATTWGRPNATDFNSVGVKNYASIDDGVAATANTIGIKNSANYSAIRQMLALKTFDEVSLPENLKKYSGGGGYVTNLMNEWRALYSQYVQPAKPTVHTKEQIYWDKTYSSSVDVLNQDRWPFMFSVTRDFTIKAVRTNGDVTLRLVLLDSNGNKLAESNSGNNITLSGTRAAGNYSVRVEAASGSGSYSLQIVSRIEASSPTPTFTPTVTPTSTPSATLPVTPETPTVTPETTEITPVPTITPAQPQASMQWQIPSVEKGQSNIAEFSFDPQGQPVKGLEYICTPDNSRLKYQNANVTSAFGENPVFAPILQPDGSFIISVAGSNGQVMSSSGVVGSVTLETIGAGQASIDCTVRRLTTADELQQVPFKAEMLTIIAGEVTPLPTITPTPIEEVTPHPTLIPTTEPTIENNPTSSGKITLSNNAYSSAKIIVQNTAGEEVAAMVPDADGNFQVTLQPGQYIFIASAPGFLSAQRSENITGDTTLPAVTLLAGDINQDGKINAQDVVTLGNVYNKAPLPIPAADLNGDGTVNLVDLVMLAFNYFKNGPLNW